MRVFLAKGEGKKPKIFSCRRKPWLRLLSLVVLLSIFKKFNAKNLQALRTEMLFAGCL